MTGAPMPDGADAIVMVERTAPRRRRRRARAAEAKAGDHIRQPGGDLEAGQIGVRGGHGASGRARRRARERGRARRRGVPAARVGVLSTGDELVERGRARAGPDPRLQPTDAARTLAAAAGVEVVDLGLARDDEDLIVGVLEDAFARCDAVLTSGGVSMGEYDYVKAALDRFGVARVAPGGDQAGEAARVRGGAGGPGVRAPRQPGVVARELRAVRSPGAALDDGVRRRPPARGRRPGGARVHPASRRQGAPRPGAGHVGGRRVRGGEHRRQRVQRALGDRGRERSRASCPTATASPPATRSPSCSSPDDDALDGERWRGSGLPREGRTSPAPADRRGSARSARRGSRSGTGVSRRTGGDGDDVRMPSPWSIDPGLAHDDRLGRAGRGHRRSGGVAPAIAGTARSASPTRARSATHGDPGPASAVGDHPERVDFGRVSAIRDLRVSRATCPETTTTGTHAAMGPVSPGSPQARSDQLRPADRSPPRRWLGCLVGAPAMRLCGAPIQLQPRRVATSQPRRVMPAGAAR